jgi:hypothetical protein
MTASHYETSNVYLASFLLCQGATLAEYEHVTHRRVMFRFEANEKLHELLRIYWSHTQDPVVPASLFDSLQRLKSLVRRKPGTARGVSNAHTGPTSPPLQAADGTVPSRDRSRSSPCPPTA